MHHRPTSSSSSSSLDSDGDDDVTIQSAWQHFISLLSDSEEEEEEEEENSDELDAGRDVVDGSGFSFKGSTGPHTKRARRTDNKEMITRLWMREFQRHYTQLEYFRVFCGTWNVNGQEPSDDLRKWLSVHDQDRPPDIYAIGFQEVDRSLSLYVNDQSVLEEEWTRKVAVALSETAEYTMLERCRLVGTMLLVFIRAELLHAVTGRDSQWVGTGLLGRFGNKGGVGVRFQLHNTAICFVCAHLAAHTEDIEGRNQDYSQISSKLIFSPDSSEIIDHDAVFWLGDLNYRLDDIANDECKKQISEGQLDDLWRKHDQLRRQMSEKRAFNKFSEGRITFIPTYKYDQGTHNWDSSSKNRTPAWCDRILWRGDDAIRLQSYRSYPSFSLSDHKPVGAVFDLGVRVIVAQRERQVRDDVIKAVSHRHRSARSLPKVSVHPTHVQFNDVRCMELQHRKITLKNIGDVPVHFQFVSGETGSHCCKPWLTILPSRRFIHSKGKTSVQLEVFVDMRDAARLNTGTDQLRDNLIIRVDGGEDICLSVSGNFIKSGLGSRTDTLAQQRHQLVVNSIMMDGASAAGARSTCARRMNEIVEDFVEGDGPIPTVIPAEIQCLVEFLVEHALDKIQLLEIAGLQCELRVIRECLDNDTPEKLPRNVHSVMEALMTVLDSYEEPVIPFDFYQRCIDAHDDVTRSRQVLSLIPVYHRAVFEYICEFCRTLLKHSDNNKLSAGFIATVFGNLLLRPPVELGPRSADDERKCAQFFRYFIE